MPGPTDLVDDVALDAALARTYARHGVLRRRRATHRTWLAGGVLAVALGAGATAIITAGGSSHEPVKFGSSSTTVVVTTTTLDPEAGIGVPAGFEMSTDGSVTVLQRKITEPGRPDVQSSLDIGTAATMDRLGVKAVGPGPVRRSVKVRFACISKGHVLDAVRYELVGNELRITATASAVREDNSPEGPPCQASDVGPSIILPLTDPLPSGSISWPGQSDSP